MIRIAVFSRSDEFHRAMRRSIQQWGIAQLALSARSVREIASSSGFDSVVAHEAQGGEIDAIAGALDDQPLIVVGEASGLSVGRHDGNVITGIGSDDDPHRVIAAAVASVYGLSVGDANDALPYRPSGSVHAHRDPEDLTPREMEVFQLISAGHPNREIARVLGITENTVKYHLSGLFGKLGVANRTEATFEGIRRGMITL